MTSYSHCRLWRTMSEMISPKMPSKVDRASRTNLSKNWRMNGKIGNSCLQAFYIIHTFNNRYIHTVCRNVKDNLSVIKSFCKEQHWVSKFSPLNAKSVSRRICWQNLSNPDLLLVVITVILMTIYCECSRWFWKKYSLSSSTKELFRRLVRV